MNRKYEHGWKSMLPKCGECGNTLSTMTAKLCRKCYNKTLSGDGNPFYGKRHSDEWKINIHKSRKSYRPSEETRDKIRKHNILSGKRPPIYYGEEHPMWSGGKRPLEKKIREIREYDIWRQVIFDRDNYTCLRCGVRGGKLRVHHKILFRTLMNDFLSKYDQFDAIEDKDILIRLSVSYEPFWDIDNGETLCNDCHLIEHTSSN